jgi:hypothetical protein
MKRTEHVTYLISQGHKTDELLKLGFSRNVITRAKRLLKEERVVSDLKNKKAISVVQDKHTTSMEEFREKELLFEGKLQQLESRFEEVEALTEEVDRIKATLHNTPIIGLRRQFQCDCGASGLVAVHIKCTRCNKETYYGWMPK